MEEAHTSALLTIPKEVAWVIVSYIPYEELASVGVLCTVVRGWLLDERFWAYYARQWGLLGPPCHALKTWDAYVRAHLGPQRVEHGCVYFPSRKEVVAWRTYTVHTERGRRLRVLLTDDDMWRISQAVADKVGDAAPDVCRVEVTAYSPEEGTERERHGSGDLVVRVRLRVPREEVGEHLEAVGWAIHLLMSVHIPRPEGKAAMTRVNVSRVIATRGRPYGTKVLTTFDTRTRLLTVAPPVVAVRRVPSEFGTENEEVDLSEGERHGLARMVERDLARLVRRAGLEVRVEEGVEGGRAPCIVVVRVPYGRNATLIARALWDFVEGRGPVTCPYYDLRGGEVQAWLSS